MTLGGRNGRVRAPGAGRYTPTFIYNFLGLERYTIASSQRLPKGECIIHFDFAYDGGGMGKGGTGALSINGEKVGEGP